jgi:lysophospholipase L1-like esterase
MRKFLILAQLLATLAASSAAEPLPRRGDFIAMGGDSITYMSQYSRFVEMYLLATRPDLDLRVMKIQRWCGGRADEYANETLEEELMLAKPNLFTVCFGMNDGKYSMPNPTTELRYEEALTKIVRLNRGNGTTTVLCAPGVVDEFSYRNAELAAVEFNKANGTPSSTAAPGGNASAEIYNRTLARLRDVARRVAEREKMPFADVHAEMWKVMQSAKSDYGTTWPKLTSSNYPDRSFMLCSDGVHPCVSGHIPMAYAVLMALGFDGDIGDIRLDWAKGETRTDAAQHAAVRGKGIIALESGRLPMCFFDDTVANEGYPSVPCRYVLQRCPFNQDLNRYMLRVSGLPNKLIKVTWGEHSLCYTRDQLEAGINLAAEFPDNPFSPTLRSLDTATYRKQVYERNLFGILNTAIWDRHFAQQKPELRREYLRKSLGDFCAWAAKEFSGNRELIDACENIRQRAVEKGESIQPSELIRIRQILIERQREYHARSRALVKPVSHVIRVEPFP